MYKITTWLCHVVDFNVSIKLRMTREKKAKIKIKPLRNDSSAIRQPNPPLKLTFSENYFQHWI